MLDLWSKPFKTSHMCPNVIQLWPFVSALHLNTCTKTRFWCSTDRMRFQTARYRHSIHSVILSSLLPCPLSSHSLPPSYEICHFPSPALTHYLRWHLSGLNTAPSGPAITIAIKRRVIAELRAMSSILQTGPALRLPVLLCWWFYITLSKCLYGWPTDIWSHYIVWWSWPSRVIMPLINRSEWGTRYAH